MRSIARHIDGYDIFQEIRLEREVHKGAFLLVEGATDIKRFKPFIDDQVCSSVNCYGRRNAIKAMKILGGEGFDGAVAIIDADFDRITGHLLVHEGIIYSASHDLDLDWATATVIQKYLVEVGDGGRLGLYDSVDDFVNEILLGLKLVSVAKLLNHQGHIRYKLSDIDVSQCVEGLSVDVDRYIDLMFKDQSVNQATKDALKQQITGASYQCDHDLRQLTNGHDFHCALGAALRSEVGSRRDVHTWGSEVEMHLRLAFGDNDFKNLQIYTDILTWASGNNSFRIIHSRLLPAS